MLSRPPLSSAQCNVVESRESMAPNQTPFSVCSNLRCVMRWMQPLEGPVCVLPIRLYRLARRCRLIEALQQKFGAGPGLSGDVDVPAVGIVPADTRRESDESRAALGDDVKLKLSAREWAGPPAKPRGPFLPKIHMHFGERGSVLAKHLHALGCGIEDTQTAIQQAGADASRFCPGLMSQQQA